MKNSNKTIRYYSNVGIIDISDCHIDIDNNGIICNVNDIYNHIDAMGIENIEIHNVGDILHITICNDKTETYETTVYIVAQHSYAIFLDLIGTSNGNY